MMTDTGAPAAASYKNKSGGIIDVLEDMKEKAEGELSDLRKAEGASKANFMMLKQSLENQLAADNKEFDDEKSGVAAAKEEKAAAEGDLESTTKELANGAADHEATMAARDEELGVIAKAKDILQESSSGAVAQSYGFLQIQLQTRTDLANSEVIQAIKDLAAKEHSVALSQLASRVQAVVAYGSEDVFGKIKGMIS